MRRAEAAACLCSALWDPTPGPLLCRCRFGVTGFAPQYGAGLGPTGADCSGLRHERGEQGGGGRAGGLLWSTDRCYLVSLAGIGPGVQEAYERGSLIGPGLDPPPLQQLGDQGPVAAGGRMLWYKHRPANVRCQVECGLCSPTSPCRRCAMCGRLPGWQGVSSRCSAGRRSHVFGLFARFT